METQKEVELGEDAPHTDAVVLKKDPHAVLPDAAGCFFKEYNVIEFKGFGSGISIRVFYKALGYALFYMSIDKKVEEVPEVDNVTVTVLQHQTYFSSSSIIYYFMHFQSFCRKFQQKYPNPLKHHLWKRVTYRLPNRKKIPPHLM